jgi:hypothetical protein
MTVNNEEAGDFRSKPRWSAGRKMDVVLRLLRGEKLEELSRELGVEAHRIAVWRDEFLEGGREGLKGRSGSSTMSTTSDEASPPSSRPTTTSGSSNVWATAHHERRSGMQPRPRPPNSYGNCPTNRDRNRTTISL